jgi:hypothetical protein
MIAPAGSDDAADWSEIDEATGAGRLKVSVDNRYLLVRMGPYFALKDRPDTFDAVAIEAFMVTGLEHGIDRALFDTSQSTHGFGINTFRLMADCHRKTGYRLRKIAVVATSKSEPLRVELAQLVVAPTAGGPEVRVFPDSVEAEAWLHADED